MKKETVYTDGAATLYHADFLDAAGSIQDNSIDFVFTDPPFELTGGGMKHSKLSYQGGEIFCKNGFSTKGIEFQKWVPEIYRVLKHGLVLVYKCGQEKLNNLYYQMKEQRRCSTWRKIKNLTLRNLNSRSWICIMPEGHRIHNWNVNMA